MPQNFTVAGNISQLESETMLKLQGLGALGVMPYGSALCTYPVHLKKTETSRIVCSLLITARKGLYIRSWKGLRDRGDVQLLPAAAHALVWAALTHTPPPQSTNTELSRKFHTSSSSTHAVPFRQGAALLVSCPVVLQISMRSLKSCCFVTVFFKLLNKSSVLLKLWCLRNLLLI